jgi:flagellar protein FliS
MREYQRQDIYSSTPLQLVVKLYDMAISACYRGDRKNLRDVLTELMAGLNLDEGGDIAGRLFRLYEYCMDSSVSGDLVAIRNVLTELREAWKQVAMQEAA